MSSDMLSTRIDHETKIAFTQICEQMGLSTSQAIKLFARAVINHGGIPFELKARQPNETSIQAMQELASGQGKRADTVSSLFDELTDGKIQHV